MDRRWLIIFIILIIGLGCMFLIAITSTTVGSAIVDINKTTVALPNGFTKEASTEGSLELINENTNEDIYIEDLGTTDISKESYYRTLETLNASTDLIQDRFHGNKTNVFNNINTYTTYYTNSSDSKAFNSSMSYIYSAGHTFYIKMSGYADIDKLNGDLGYIVSTIQPDYKKSQD